MKEVNVTRTPRPGRGPRLFNLRHAMPRRLPVILAAGVFAAALPLVALASVQVQIFGPSRFISLGNCAGGQTNSTPCPAVEAISKSSDSSDPGLRATGIDAIDAIGELVGIDAAGELDAVNAHSTNGKAVNAVSTNNTAVNAVSTKAIGVQADGATVGVVANGTGTIGVGVEAHGTTLAVEALSDNTALGATGGKIGVFAHSFDGTGVDASSSNGTGVRATGNKTANSFGSGVLAIGDDAVVARGTTIGVDATGLETGVAGFSDKGVGGDFFGARAPIRLRAAHTPGAPTTGAHSVGELYVDSNGVLFICKADGTPGQWVKVGSQ